MSKGVLGEFEHQVLLSVLRCRGGAYSVPIVLELEERTGREVAPAAVYIALRRLEEKALARSELKQPEPPNPGLFGTGFLFGWTRTFSLGLSGQQGNSDTTDLTMALDADAENEKRRWAFDARYNLSIADGDTTKNNAMTSLGRDWLFPESKWFAFAAARFDYDDFRTWTFRIQGEGGLGYEIFTYDSFQLRARTGPSVVQEWSEDQFRAEGMIGPELVWKPLENQSLEASNFFFYAFTPWAEYRNVSRIQWRWNLTEEPVLSLMAGVENEYQSDVEAGFKNNDLKYFTTVGLDF